MRIHGDSWGFMGIRGKSQKFKRIQRNPWEFVGIGGVTSGSFGFRADSRGLTESHTGSLGIHADLWGFMRNCWDSWGPMGKYGDSKDYVGTLGVS